ncbi:hypothetical protein MMC28_010793 [Mycoblastus sanguinarius]|nr:hypothetical protein [Mycoblastus sanguinarius]
MAESVDIVPATLEDLPAISSIWPQSMKFDLMMNFIFPNHLYDPSVPEKAMYNMYARAMQQPNMQFFKAVSRARGDTVGFAGWRREDGNEARDKDYRIRPEWPDGVDAETATLYFGGLMRIEKMLMSGRKHVVLTSLHVLPAYQRKGIGSLLVRYGLETLRFDELPVFLSTQMRGRNFYSKLGWEDADFLDIDLEKWAGPLSGYGVHRSPCMIRPPGRGLEPSKA